MEPLQHIYNLSKAVTRAADVEDICQVALDGLRKSIGVDRASVLLFDERRVMRFKSWISLSDGYREAVEGHSP